MGCEQPCDCWELRTQILSKSKEKKSKEKNNNNNKSLPSESSLKYPKQFCVYHFLEFT